MRASIDADGRVTIPKAVRDQLGIGPGPVEVVADGMTVRIELVTDDRVELRDGLLVIPAHGEVIDDEQVDRLRCRGHQ
jgi:AbrB family looped-hinge helix DNA binding protein